MSGLYTGFGRGFGRGLAARRRGHATGHVSRRGRSPCASRGPRRGGGDGCSSCTVPVPSVARTWRTWSPGVASHGSIHWTQVASEIGCETVAGVQVPSMPTSTRLMPRSGAQAMPAIATRPACSRPVGVSIRDWVRIGRLLGPAERHPVAVERLEGRELELGEPLRGGDVAVQAGHDQAGRIAMGDGQRLRRSSPPR